MSDIIVIGNTNYYAVRKGTNQYRIAEGKRLSDPEFCWQLLKDPDSGKQFFINGKGRRRWHLPDIYMSEREMVEEAEELRFRRQRKAEQAKEEAADGDGAKSDVTGGTERQSEAATGELQVRTFAARERSAMQLPPLREWEDPEKRREVIKFCKSIISPYLTQGALDEKGFASVVGTASREFCASKHTFGEEQKNQLREEIVAMAFGVMTEQKRKDEYAKMNDDLMEKVKRLDGERKQLVTEVQSLTRNEDAMKEEIFKLRAHKQDILLGSFKRLTRAGLVQTYWKRWIHHKGVVEAQLHVRARERRALEMTGRISELEEKETHQDETIRKLQERVQQSEGRDAISVLLKQSGLHTMKRCFHNWQRWAQEAMRENQFHQLREQLVNCPNCELHRVEINRVRNRLTMTIDVLRQKEALLVEAEAQRDMWKTKNTQSEDVISSLQQIVQDGNDLTATFSQRCTDAENHATKSDEQIRFLQNELDKLHFEYSTFTGGAVASEAVADVETDRADGRGSTRHRPTAVGQYDEKGNRALLQQQQQSTYGGARGQHHVPSEPSNPMDRSSFWASEVDTGAGRLQKMFLKRSKDEGLQRAEAEENGPAGTHARGIISQNTESALAPLVRPLPTKSGEQKSELFPGSQNRTPMDSRHPQQQKDLLFAAPTPISLRRRPDEDQAGYADDADSDDSDESLSRLVDETDEDYVAPPPPPPPPFGDGSSPRRGESASPSSRSREPYSGGTAGTPQRRYPQQQQQQQQQPVPAPVTTSAIEGRELTRQELDEDGKCPKCGFKKKLTQFCPRDGSRHLFAAFSREYRDPQSLLHHNYQTGGAGAAGEPGVHSSPPHPLVTSGATVQFGTTGGGAQSMLDAKVMGLPPSKEVLLKRQQGVDRPDLRSMLNLDPRTYEDPTATPAAVAADPQHDTTHYREVADLMRATRIAAENERQVRRVMGKENGDDGGDEDLHALRSVLAPRPLMARHDEGPAAGHSSMPSKQHSQPAMMTSSQELDRTGATGSTGRGSRWGNLFDFNDVTNGTLGVQTESVDHVFGVFRGDHAPPPPPSRRYLQEQQQTPNLR